MRQIVPPLVLVIRRSGLRQKQIARALGCSESTVSKWCNGVHRPDSESIERLSVMLDASREEMLGE